MTLEAGYMPEIPEDVSDFVELAVAQYSAAFDGATIAAPQVKQELGALIDNLRPDLPLDGRKLAAIVHAQIAFGIATDILRSVAEIVVHMPVTEAMAERNRQYGRIATSSFAIVDWIEQEPLDRASFTETVPLILGGTGKLLRRKLDTMRTAVSIPETLAVSETKLR